MKQETLLQNTVKDYIDTNDNFNLYHKFCKPKLADMLNSLKLDYSYERAKGNYVYFKNGFGEDVPVLDFVGGFGATFLGHNNPKLKDVIKRCMDQDVPMFTQSALRPAANRLAQKLNELIPAKNNYYCNFSNSGAESVEAAFKHAYKIRLDAIQRKYEEITRGLHDIYHLIEDEKIDIILPKGVKELSKYRDDLDEYNLAQYEKFQNNPVFVAFKGSFHGKTTSALKVTFNKTFREGFEGLSAIRTVFIDLDKPERLKEIVKENEIDFILPEMDGNTLVLRRHPMTCVVAIILEVVLGEGGVKPLPDNTMQCLANMHDELSIPFIIDEIQTGCGRTGCVFGYSETPLASIEPEYVLLSKALGGGIVKIGVTMIKETIYDLDFGFLHTSTFAEDDISCTVALETLRIITENDNFLLKEAKSKGEYLRTQLQKLKIKYPQIVKDIRGKGLMTGLEFHDLSQYGPIFRYAGRQGFISLLVTSYLLNYHQIRVLAPLTTLFKGNPGKKRESVLRIQPPVFITLEEIDRLAKALDETFGIIESNNEFCLMGHLLGAKLTNQERQSPKNIPVLYPELKHQTDFDARIGFIVHITELKHLVDYYLPAFKEYQYENAKLIKWWNKLCRFLEPDVMHRTYIESDGFIIETNFVCVPYFPKYIIKTFSNAKIANNPDVFSKKYLTEIQDKIIDAAILARDLGDERIPTSVVGLGAYTSIVTENGTTMNDFEIPITTGNAYTTALMGQGIVKASEIINIDISESNAAVIGAAGNIGSTISALLSFYCKKIFLIGSGKTDSQIRLKSTINTCLKAILTEIKSQLPSVDNSEEIDLHGLALDIYFKHVFPFLNEGNSKETDKQRVLINTIKTPGLEITDETASILEQLIIENAPNKTNPYFEIRKLDDIKECHIVAIATNSPDGLIKPELVKDGAIVCCASVPSNLSDTFKNQLDKYFVFDGGLAKLPEGNIIDFVGMPKHGMAYGCLCETLLMAFNGQNSSFAKGQINTKQVMKTIELSDIYGFEVGDFRLGDSIISIN
jgi:acetylornithine/succinyldiaminopimelate/putrescine aminotransferase/predicted amino acid dehydrogenase